MCIRFIGPTVYIWFLLIQSFNTALQMSPWKDIDGDFMGLKHVNTTDG